VAMAAPRRRGCVLRVVLQFGETTKGAKRAGKAERTRRNVGQFFGGGQWFAE
jgi:hypothetical protein